MDIEQKKLQAKTIVAKAIFPNTTNHYNTLMGGNALQIMDEVAFICATRFSRKKMVTVSSSKVDFKRPIPAGTIAEFVATIYKIGNTSVKVKVVIYTEQMYKDGKQEAIEGLFTLVAINNDKTPISVF